MVHTWPGPQPIDTRAAASSPSPRICAMMVAAVSHDISSPPTLRPRVGGGTAAVGGQKQSAVLGQSGSSIVISGCGFEEGQHFWSCVMHGAVSAYANAGWSFFVLGGEVSVSLGLA